MIEAVDTFRLLKEIRDLISITKESEDDTKEAVQVSYEEMTKEEKDTFLMKLEKEMKISASAPCSICVFKDPEESKV